MFVKKFLNPVIIAPLSTVLLCALMVLVAWAFLTSHAKTSSSKNPTTVSASALPQNIGVQFGCAAAKRAIGYIEAGQFRKAKNDIASAATSFSAASSEDSVYAELSGAFSGYTTPVLSAIATKTGKDVEVNTQLRDTVIAECEKFTK